MPHIPYGHCRKALQSEDFRKLLLIQIYSLESMLQLADCNKQAQYLHELEYFRLKLAQVDRIRQKMRIRASAN